MPRFAANLTVLYTELPFAERFAAAARDGFVAVECQFPYALPSATIAELLAREGLELVLHNLPCGGGGELDRGAVCDPARRKEFQALVETALEYALTLGCPRLNCLTGSAPAGLAAQAVRETLLDNLDYAARACAAHGRLLLLEPLNTADNPGVLLHRSAQALALIDTLGAANLALQYDVYHMHIMEGDVPEALPRLLPRIGHIQIADHPGRHEPGSGEIDFAAVFEILDRGGYAGWVGCEYRPRQSTTDGLDWLTLFN